MKLLQELLSITEAKSEIIRGHDGKALRGMKKELAVRARDQKWKFDPEQASRDKKEVYHSGKATVRRVSEEAIEVQTAEDVWKEHKSEAKTYISNEVFFVKKLQGGSKFEVLSVQNNKRVPFATLSTPELTSSFTPMRADDAPDAEGYLQYRKSDQVRAIEYTGDTVKTDIGDNEVISEGDYLIQSVKGSDFEYQIMDSKNFNMKYNKK
jgi:hypothetical protein